MTFKKILQELFVDNVETTNEKEMLRLSIIAELDAANLYEKFSKQTNNISIKKVMLDIAKEEKVHAGEFRALLQAIDKDAIQTEIQGKNEVDELINRT
jgi:rubrerythrin